MDPTPEKSEGRAKPHSLQITGTASGLGSIIFLLPTLALITETVQAFDQNREIEFGDTIVYWTVSAIINVFWQVWLDKRFSKRPGSHWLVSIRTAAGHRRTENLLIWKAVTEEEVDSDSDGKSNNDIEKPDGTRLVLGSTDKPGYYSYVFKRWVLDGLTIGITMNTIVNLSLTGFLNESSWADIRHQLAITNLISIVFSNFYLPVWPITLNFVGHLLLPVEGRALFYALYCLIAGIGKHLSGNGFSW